MYRLLRNRSCSMLVTRVEWVARGCQKVYKIFMGVRNFFAVFPWVKIFFEMGKVLSWYLHNWDAQLLFPISGFKFLPRASNVSHWFIGRYWIYITFVHDIFLSAITFKRALAFGLAIAGECPLEGDCRQKNVYIYIHIKKIISHLGRNILIDMYHGGATLYVNIDSLDDI